MIEELQALTATLDLLSELDQYNEWIVERLAPVPGDRVLEVGAGTGNITDYLRRDARELVATDVLPAYRRHLAQRFEGDSRVRIGSFNLDQPIPAELLAEPFDTVVCLNVLEHIADDLGALREMGKALRPGGRLALLVPAHPLLYGEFDRAVGHFRRYRRSDLRALLEEAGFRVARMEYFNILATIPWLINGRVLKRGYLPGGQASLANKLVPLLKWERLFGPPAGISLIAIAGKP